MDAPPFIPTPPPIISTTPPVAKFTLPLMAWGVWGAGAGWMVIRTVLRDTSLSPYEWGQLLGSIVGTLLFPMLLSWVVWRLARRSDLARNITFFVVITMAVLGQVRPSDARIARILAEEVEADRQRMLSEQRADLAAGKPIDQEKALAFYERTSAHLRETAAKSTGENRAVAEAAQAFTDRSLEINRRHSAATAGLGIETFFEIAPLAKPETLAARRESVQAFVTTNREMAAADGAGMFKRELDQRMVSAAVAKAALAGYEKRVGPQRALVAKILESDAQFAAAMNDFLDLAEGKHGKWQIEEGTNEVLFDTDAAVERYNEILARVRRIGSEQTEYHKQFVAPAK